MFRVSRSISFLVVLAVSSIGVLVASAPGWAAPMTSSESAVFAGDDGEAKPTKDKASKQTDQGKLADIAALAAGSATVTVDGTTWKLTADSGGCTVRGSSGTVQTFKGRVTDGTARVTAAIEVVGRKATLKVLDLDDGYSWSGSTSSGVVRAGDGAAGALTVKDRTLGPAKASFAFHC